MTYPKLDMAVIELARRSKKSTETVRDRVSRVTSRLAEEFAGDYAQDMGIVFSPSSDGQEATISTPFGDARATSNVYLGEDGAYARYVFEKKGKDSIGRDSWHEVFHFEVNEYGKFRADIPFDDVQYFSVLAPYREQYFMLALSITAAIGRSLV